MFAPIQLVAGGQGLHKIYVNPPKATTQKQIFNELDEIRSMRNRIAHHEPICFDKHHKIFTDHTKRTYDYIIKQTSWLGYDPNKPYLGLDETLQIITTIENER